MIILKKLPALIFSIGFSINLLTINSNRNNDSKNVFDQNEIIIKWGKKSNEEILNNMNKQEENIKYLKLIFTYSIQLFFDLECKKSQEIEKLFNSNDTKKTLTLKSDLFYYEKNEEGNKDKPHLVYSNEKNEEKVIYWFKDLIVNKKTEKEKEYSFNFKFEFDFEENGNNKGGYKIEIKKMILKTEITEQKETIKIKEIFQEDKEKKNNVKPYGNNLYEYIKDNQDEYILINK
jgi:hypothetical protein